MASFAPLESHLPKTKLAAVQGKDTLNHCPPARSFPLPSPALAPTAPPPGILLPDWFSPPPGLAPPPGLSGLASPSAEKAVAGGEDSAESDTEVTSVGTASFEGAGSSERDETEPEELEEAEASPLKANAPCFVPGQLSLESDSPKRTPLRTPLRKSAGLFVPGSAPALPFVPMAKVQEAWKRWEENQYQHGGEQTFKESSSKRGARQRNGKSWH